MWSFLVVLACAISYAAAKSSMNCKTVECHSFPGKLTERPVTSEGGVHITRVELVERLSSSTPCEKGQTFGYNAGKVWTYDGCKAIIRACYIPKDKPKCKTMRCKSSGATKSCPVNSAEVFTKVKVKNQRGKQPCKFPTTFNFVINRLVVTDGCDADFDYCYIPMYDTIKCESKDKKRTTCKTRGILVEDIQLNKRISGSCIKGETFGFLGKKIWTDKGCKAEFRVYYLV